MKPLNDIIINPNFEPKPKLTAHIDQLNILIGALRHMSIPDVNIDFINQVVSQLNQPFISKSEYMALLTKTKPRILGHLESELKIVPKNYNRKKWMLLGMSAFGIPFGAILSWMLGNFAFLGIGLPIGMYRDGSWFNNR